MMDVKEMVLALAKLIMPLSFPVTDPDIDAPDGAVVNGYERRGSEWVRLEIERVGSEADVSALNAVIADIAHLEVGSRMWARRLDMEKKCGMTHTDEINGWLKREKERESQADRAENVKQ